MQCFDFFFLKDSTSSKLLTHICSSTLHYHCTVVTNSHLVLIGHLYTHVALQALCASSELCSYTADFHQHINHWMYLIQIFHLNKETWNMGT